MFGLHGDDWDEMDAQYLNASSEPDPVLSPAEKRYALVRREIKSRYSDSLGFLGVEVTSAMWYSSAPERYARIVKLPLLGFTVNPENGRYYFFFAQTEDTFWEVVVEANDEGYRFVRADFFVFFEDKHMDSYRDFYEDFKAWKARYDNRIKWVFT